MSDETSETRARSWASKTVEAYAKAVPGGTMGLHNHLVSSSRPALFASATHEGPIDRINRAIEDWEKWSLRQPGPRVISLDEVTGTIEMR